jgi:enoyl-CoA hydratase/carnithine racemase
MDHASLSTHPPTVSIDDGVASVRLNRADKLNALDVPMLSALVDTAEQLKQDSSVRVVILSGEGRGFCAGLDVGSLQAMSGGDTDSQPSDGVLQQMGETGGRITHLGQQAAYVWQELQCPVIAVLHGVVLGGGCQIALCADMRIASPNARFSVLEIRWGLVPDMTGTAMLPLLVGLDVAKELSFTGRMFSAEEAARIGLVTRVSDSPRDDALALAQEIAHNSPQAIRGVKKLLNQARYASLAEQFRAERETIKPLLGSKNQVEAVMAHLEKRDPVFED